MTNIIEILKGLEITIPEDKLSDFNKAFNENYKTIVEHQKALDKAANEKKRADTAEEALKGFEGIDPNDVQKQLNDAKTAIKAAQDEAARQIAERDFNDALRAEVEKLTFTSAAAKRDFENFAKGKKLSAENGKILGFNDAVELYKSENPDALAVNGGVKPKFTEPNNPTNAGGKSLTKKDIMAIKDDKERYRLMDQNRDLFMKKG